MSILSVQNLTKKFNNFTAVDDISFHLNEGEILGLLGPNGAGKTTTLQMLLGVLTPSGGEISYFGKNLFTHREEILEQVNYSSTYVGLPELLTVKENLSFISYLYTIPNRKKRLSKIIDIFNLKELLNTKFGRLSAGQKTRVSLAKAMLNFPRVLLLDEPTASLDPDVAQYVREFLEHQRQEFNVSIIITSHNMAEVEEMCDRVIFINHGTLIADDSPQNLAQSIEVAHITLLSSQPNRLVSYCAAHNLSYRTDNKYIIIDVLEKNIAEFLKSLCDASMTYSEISIAKPNLEDYFLQVVQNRSLSSRRE